MSMLWDQRCSTVTTGKHGTMFVNALRAATIAAIASSCSTIDRQYAKDSSIIPAQQQGKRDDIISLEPEENALIQEFLATHGYDDVSNVLIVSINYTTRSEGEKLTAFKFDRSTVEDTKDYPKEDFRIPGENPGNWMELSEGDRAIVIYTMSPGAAKSCTGGLGTVTC
jgi:hypothetical protein